MDTRDCNTKSQSLSKIFGEFWPKPNPFKCTFFFNMKVPMVFKLSAKSTWPGKIWLLSYGPETSRLIRMLDFVNCNISQTSRSLIFVMWLDIHRCNKFIKLFVVGVSHVLLKDELSFKFRDPWLRILER